MVSDKFRFFAWYTLIAGGVVTVLGLFELFSGHLLQQMIVGMLG